MNVSQWLFQISLAMSVGGFVMLTNSPLYKIVIIICYVGYGIAAVQWKKGIILFIVAMSFSVYVTYVLESDTTPLQEENISLNGVVVKVRNERTYWLQTANNDVWIVNGKARPIYNACKGTFTIQHKEVMTHKEQLYHKRNGIVGYIKEQAIQCHSDSSPRFFFDRKRENLIQHAYDVLPKGDTAALMIALVFGDSQFLSSTFSFLFEKLSLIHMIAISGSHFTFLIFLLYVMGKQCQLQKDTIHIIQISIILLYGALLAFPPPVFRACFMAFILIITNMTQKELLPFTALCITYIIQLVLSPLVLLHSGFLFSYILTFSFLIILPHWQLDKAVTLFQWLKIQLVAFFIALPLELVFNGSISIMSIPFNLLFGPIFELFLFPLSLLIILLTYIMQSTPSFLFYSMDVTVNQMITFALFVTTEVPARIAFIVSPLFLVSVTLIVLCLFLFPLHQRFLLAALVCLFLFQWALPYISSRGEISIVDVGQGDGAFIQLPHREKTIMIDTGGTPNREGQEETYNITRYVWKPFFKERGIETIDTLILTHDDVDHIGEAKGLLATKTIREIVVSRCSLNGSLTKEILQEAKRKNVKLSIIDESQQWSFKEVNVHVFVPFPQCQKEDNKNSLVVHITGLPKGESFLFMGDVDEEGEEYVIKNNPHLQTTYLKVGHHGSKTSTSNSFLKSIRPRHAIISAGKANRYGHPHQQVVALLQEYNVSIWRTDEQSTFTYFFTEKK